MVVVNIRIKYGIATNKVLLKLLVRSMLVCWDVWLE
jgi:hypothetical protein